MAEIRKELCITNASGLHARPCHALVSTSLEYAAELRVRCGDREVNGKSILELMTLSAACGSTLEICATGDDALELVERLSALISAGFDES